ncbi:hypothetical protein HPB47_013146 [Ixodes persulcatus]|uniref:Uncharacterized protein n=1 Tax=Ixodes persulcatus TaxID=34615 RepID=A0AC60NRI0_IXOPE|nr:hypothetical protein HPB47_013146 [Ixodes persulcatus]
MTKLTPAKTVPKAVSRCCAPTCANSSDNTDGVCFFRFPKDEERCKKWVANCGRADLEGKPAEKLFSSYYLCSAHFRKGCFSSRYRNRLVWNAVPTVFKHTAKEEPPAAAKATAKASANLAKPTRAGTSVSQQRFRRFFGFASKRRTSVQLRPGAPMLSSAPSPPQLKGAAMKDIPQVVKAEAAEAESPRLPVYIEDHLYAAHTAAHAAAYAAVQPVFSTRFSMPSPSQSGVNRVHEIIVDHLDGDRLVMDVVEGGSIMDEKDAEAFKAAVEAALPLLQLSQQVPLGPPPRQTVVVTTSAAPPTYARPKEEPSEQEAEGGSSRGRASRKGPRMMQDFLLPHLDRGTFGERLQWLDRANGVFQIGWYHKNAAQWTKDDCVVFLEWDRLKKRPVAQNPHYWMEAKQRFRAALGKVTFGWTQPRCKATGGELKNVKVRKIKWTRDMRPPLGDTWQPRDPNWASVTHGRVHRPTISRVRRQSPPPQLPYGKANGGRWNEEEEEEEDSWGAPGDPCVCHRCGYTTRNRRVFLRHRMMHRDVRAFCCRYCTQRFCLPESLFLHLQVHSETFPYSCSSCGVKTRLLLQLWRHELRRLAQRLCLCHRCGLVCHVRENLRYHLAKAHGQNHMPAPDPNRKLAPVCTGEFGRPAMPKLKGGQAKPTGGQKSGVRKPKPAEPKSKPTKPRAGKPKAAEKSTAGRPKANKIGGAKGAARKPAATKTGANKSALGRAAAKKSAAIKSEPDAEEAGNTETSVPAAGELAASKGAADAPAAGEPKPKGPEMGAWEDAEEADSGQCETIELIIDELRRSEPGAKKLGSDDAPAAQERPKKKARATAPPVVPPPVVLKVPTQTNHAGVVLAGMVTEQGLRRTQRIRTPKRKISA